MELKKENLILKITLCKMIRQFMCRRNVNGIEYFDDYCESAGEWAFKSLQIQDDLVRTDKIDEIEEVAGDELLKINKTAG